MNLYSKHCDNLRLIESAIKCTERSLRENISKKKDNETLIFTRILSHLVNTWAEVRILKLIYENTQFKYSSDYEKYDAFNKTEKFEVLTQSSLEQKWITALKISFSKAYKLSTKDLDNLKVPFTARSRYSALIDVIKSDLLESSELRNRIAHGQWLYALNKDLKSINPHLTGKLRQENIVNLQLKLKMFKSMAQIIHDLAVSKLTFERDFDKNYRKIEEQKRNFHSRDYDNYKEKMIEKKRRGITQRSK